MLDTDILSNLMKRTSPSSLVARVVRVPPEHQFTSSITLGELVYGAQRLSERTAILLERIPIGDADVRIAAIALTHGLKVVTGNQRHFRQIPGLETENWLEE